MNSSPESTSLGRENESPLLSLPTELLCLILDVSYLSNSDLASCRRTCRRLNTVAHDLFNPTYIFKVDHPSRSPWQMIRRLLVHPELGKNLNTIKVEWYRRQAGRPETWTKQWIWTPQETLQLTILAKDLGFDEFAMNAISYGINSEVLLLVLLTFTSRLRHLDFGATEAHIVRGNTIGETMDTLRECYAEPSYFILPESETKTLDESSPKLRNYYGGLMSTLVPGEPDWAALWFHEYLRLDKLPRGLKNVRSIKHGYNLDAGRCKGFYPRSVPRMLYLPRIRSIMCHRCSSDQVEHLGTLWDRGVIAKWESKNFFSDIERIELIDCALDPLCIESIATMTQGLEYFKWSSPDGEKLTESTEQLFFANNKNLRKENLVFGSHCMN
ncbi:hypothetical protein H072_10537 [Dactylellina haptotyla CBS 200.50]|uniref:F-box domain-containing protein n=1 Tax=Dactylellina haptotyla (strain CBS 200.50) TaxID=1284197 RepID=S7ZZ59_DACHA|nr:hypothetical protein H072_10537 [Dactylellina haptotyla CBS 200.50]